MDTIGAHTYSGNDSERHTLRKLAASYDKGPVSYTHLDQKEETLY